MGPGEDHLQGDGAVESDLTGPIDHPHTSAAQLAENLIPGHRREAGSRPACGVIAIARRGRRPSLAGLRITRNGAPVADPRLVRRPGGCRRERPFYRRVGSIRDRRCEVGGVDPEGDSRVLRRVRLVIAHVRPASQADRFSAQRCTD
jgi:hypothetical protein